MPAETTTAIRTCPLCEATCGLELTIAGDRIVKVRGDADDVFSKGFICPKGASIAELHDDPDRLRAPLLRRPDGGFDEVSWDDAFAFIDERFRAVEGEHGRQAFGAYIGNPAAHALGALLYGRVLLKALGTRNVFSASTVDQMPKQLSAALMFGTGLSVPVPDLDRTMHLLVLGADPLVSNGSLMTSPDARGRLRGIRARGGKLVVVDPRRSRTAREADEHHFIRPGGDALLLMAIVHTLFDEGLVSPGEHLAPYLLTCLLLDRLKASAPARVVTVSSDAHRAGRMDFDDLQAQHGYSGIRAYAQSKLANILFTRELARRLDGSTVTANALHPGTVRTGFAREDAGGLMRLALRVGAILMKSPEQGARTSVYAASSPALAHVVSSTWMRCFTPARSAVRATALGVVGGSGRLWSSRRAPSATSPTTWFFFSRRRRHTSSSTVSWARRCV